VTNARVPDDELSVYVERIMRMIQLLRIYEMVLALPDEPSDRDNPQSSRKGTMMGVVYSFFYSLIEDDPQGINFFRIWRAREPSFAAELDALEARIAPFKGRLRLFRNRFGFHGSVTREHEAVGLDLLTHHDGALIYQAILDTRNLSTKLLKARLARGSA
jgi:hypothetical protein